MVYQVIIFQLIMIHCHYQVNGKYIIIYFIMINILSINKLSINKLSTPKIIISNKDNNQYKQDFSLWGLEVQGFDINFNNLGIFKDNVTNVNNYNTYIIGIMYQVKRKE